LHCYVCVWFIIHAETGVRAENATIRLTMSLVGSSIVNVSLKRIMETGIHLGIMTVRRMVLLWFRLALIIIMAYLRTDHNSNSNDRLMLLVYMCSSSNGSSNNSDIVYGAVIMALPMLWEFTQFI